MHMNYESLYDPRILGSCIDLLDGAWETKRLSEDDVDEGVCARAASLPSKTPMANDGNAESLGSGTRTLRIAACKFSEYQAKCKHCLKKF